MTSYEQNGSTELELRVENSLAGIAAEAWDACANPVAAQAADLCNAPNPLMRTSADRS